MGILGAGLTLAKKRQDEKRPDRSDLPYAIGMIVLDIAAPILLLLGLTTATAENVSLLNNFEIVATALIALLFFGEKISPRLRWAIGLITLASAILSFENIAALDFSLGSLFVLLAAVCWGLENNCTRRLSEKDPLQIVVVKGLCSGAGSLIIGLALGQRAYDALAIFGALLLGFVAYGLSIFVYVYAQRHIGAAKTSAYYAIAPFIASALSLLIFRDMPNITFFIAAVVMAVGSYLAAKE
jgi:drug/metabolite transporter (DMT)-like permease